MVDKRALLARCPLFQGLSGDTLQSLAARARLRAYAAGDLVFRAGSPGDSMMVVAEGEVRITALAPTARDVILSELGPGSAFGEIAVLDGGQRSADAHARTNCSLLILDRRDLLHAMREDPDLSEGLLKLLCARLRRSDSRMMDLAFLPLPARLAGTLLRLAGEARRMALPQSELADMVGASRENVNRCLRKWQADGVIGLDDGWLSLIDPGHLERLASVD